MKRFAAIASRIRQPLPIGMLALITALLLGLLLPAQAQRGLIFQDTFEQGTFQTYQGGAGWNQTQFTARSLGEIVNSPVRAGRSSARFTLRYPDRRVEKNKFAAGRPGSERWFGFSVYIPQSWRNHNGFTIAAQIKEGMPDRGEPVRSPFLPIELRNGVWQIYNRWDPNRISRPANNGNGGSIRSLKLYESPYAKGQWTDWVIHAYWSYENDGILEIWKNGTRVVNKIGANCYNDVDHDFHFKIGLYKPGYRAGEPSPLVLYFDEVRIGDSTARYADVAPRPTIGRPRSS